MPSGATHDLIGVVASPPLLVVATAALANLGGQAPAEALLGGLLLTASHLACTYWLSPDLDLDSSIHARWGPLRPLWRPYERIVPHRHWLSHSGFSAALRLLYLFIALNLLLALLGIIIVAQAALIGRYIDSALGLEALLRWMFDQYRAVSTAGLRLATTYPVYSIAIVAGAFIADMLHTGADIIDTSRKRKRKRGLRLRLSRLRFGKPSATSRPRRRYRSR